MTRSDWRMETRERRFRLFACTLGLGSAITVAVQLALAPSLIVQEWAPVLVFSLLIGFAWYFSFSIVPRGHLSISLDMGYMITALCVLERPLPLAVALLGSVLGVVLRTRDANARVKPFLPALCMNTGGLVMTALAGQGIAILMHEHWQFRELTWWTPAMIALLFVTYNLTNLAVMGLGVCFKGEPVLPYLWRYLRYIPTLEIFTIPLCLGLVLLYGSAGVWGFLPLAVTILFGSGLLKKLHRAQTDLSHTNEQLQNRSRELRTLYTIGNEISSSLDPQVVFEQMSTHVQRILDAPFVILSLKHRWPNEQYREYVNREGVIAPQSDPALGEGFTSWMVDEQRPLMLGDIHHDRESLPCAPVILDPSVRSILAAPLIVTHGTIGVLCVESPHPNTYTLDQLSILTTIAQQAAIAIENARNFQMATVDQLTELYLRDFFYRKLNEEQARARRYGSTFAVLMLDLDNFKQLNDKLGHLVGDRYLQKVGEVIRESMREPDIPCRYGGEEFCILLPEADAAGARAIAERIRTRVGAMEVRVGNRNVRATISVGIACYPADYTDSINGFIEKADKAMYAAKRAGRNRVAMARRTEGAGRGRAAEAAAGGEKVRSRS